MFVAAGIHCYVFLAVSPAELAARASPTSGNPRGRTADLRLDFKNPNSGSVGQTTMPQVRAVQQHTFLPFHNLDRIGLNSISIEFASDWIEFTWNLDWIDLILNLL